MKFRGEELELIPNFGEVATKQEVTVPHEADVFTELSNVAQRDKYVERIEVLSKVGGLLLLEDMGMATTKQVATFYNVEHHVIRDVIKVHGDELKQDGMYLAKYGEIKDEVNKDYSTLLELGVSYRGTYLFPRRSILRIGMLLRDSDVAKEVRTQLLNIEEKTEVPMKVIEVNKELELQAELGKAFMSGNIKALAQATARLSEYKNRLITEIEEERDEYKAELDVINGTDLISLKNVGLEYLGGISSTRIRKFLQYNGVLGNVKTDGHYTANVKYAKYFKLSTTVKNDRLCKTLKATREGASFIAELYEKHNAEKSA
ncbi:hypothetical protein BWGOE4_44970 [Bacillus mycoides]|uniref:hypothetical protein n=1 Tax=Bacillus mycoides TaxID=1405 RepID=UPI000871DD19|nr:hypothetical protein [Bacillus mycoides]OFD54008.1 hypothetical protein BWGOE4_44970 [Bacillus mycoides]OFD60482.1 hypothetical protein BWGOE7_45140 [Bacillus mycoides]OFD90722.1 hypothetical protein BWGOE12_45210 [Bacillus mycoides]